MPRRKQDKPQHLDEELTMSTADQTASSDRSEQHAVDESIVENNREEKIGADAGDLAKSASDDVNRDENVEVSVDGMEDESPTDVAVITNEDWSNVKSAMTSIQQQCHIIRMQQFQFMQLLASQNSDSKDLSQSTCSNQAELNSADTSLSSQQAETEDMVGAEQKNKDDNEVEITEDTEELITPDFIKQENQTEINADLEADVGSVSDNGKEDVESINLAKEWQEIEEQPEPVSYDCTQCSAVLPTPELLKMHMVTHTKRDNSDVDLLSHQQVISETVYSSNQGSSSAILHGSGSYSSLPPSYQSVISDLSNDSMEEYMEIQKPQNTHLEQLVKNMDGVVTDPNQCLICKRPLSCKSALMMHYRTHTGERPFKCRLCNRAFTTKGNLKTHFGVHRAKPPVRLMHNCPVCNKQFSNHLVLQQHMKTHEEVSPTRKRPIISDPQQQASMEDSKKLRLSQDFLYKQEVPVDSLYGVAATSDLTKRPYPPFPTSLSQPTSSAFPFDFTSFPSMQEQLRYADALSRQWEQLTQFSMFSPISSLKPSIFPPANMGLNGTGLGLPFPLPLPNVNPKLSYAPSGNSDVPVVSPDKLKSLPGEDETMSKNSSNAPVNNDASARLGNNSSPRSERSEKSWASAEASTPTTTINGMRIDPPPGTTCDICGKQHGCRSALEIHYRSHTKHRPFKCEICDKAFTTRGNMKQHILTHKPEEIQWSAQMEKANSSQVPSPTRSDLGSVTSGEGRKMGGRHQCHICLKGFSSSSAVQIHLRTHTGDRPFKCPDCGKAFTTKGNLKVHQGTHMWNTKPSSPNRQRSNSEANSDTTQEQTNSITSPINGFHPPSMTPGLNWNGLSQSALMKASIFGNPAASLMANYSGLFLPQAPPALSGSVDEPGKPWLWQVTCHICNKECQSPVALELHLKSHVVSESSSTPVPAS